MASNQDFYSVLGVKRDAPQEEIKKAYRKLARELHPDKRPGDKAAEQRFKEVSSAYDVLGDPEKRKLYDEFGPESTRAGFDPEKARAFRAWQQGRGGPGAGFDLGDLFAQFGGQAGGPGQAHAGGASAGFDFEDLLGGIFGGRAAGGRRRAHVRQGRPGRDLETTMEVGFLEALKGVERTIALPAPGGGIQNVKVRIPAGAKDGDRVRARGKGEPGTNGGPPGDLLIQVKVAPHPHLKREGDNLELTVPITIGEALKGGKIKVPTPDGEVTLKIPKKTQSGTRMRLKGRGVKHRKGKGKGDLFVVLQIHLPDTVNDAVLKAAETLEKAYSHDVRGHIRL